MSTWLSVLDAIHGTYITMRYYRQPFQVIEKREGYAVYYQSDTEIVSKLSYEFACRFRDGLNGAFNLGYLTATMESDYGKDDQEM